MSILEKVISNLCCNCFEIFLLQLKEKKSTFFSLTRVLRKDRLEWIRYWCSLGRRSRICGCRSGASPRLPWDYLGQCYSASAFMSIQIKCSDYWIIFILFVAIISDWRPPWGKLMGTPPRLLHKVLHHVKRHAGRLPDRMLLYRHFSPLTSTADSNQLQLFDCCDCLEWGMLVCQGAHSNIFFSGWNWEQR